MAFSAPVVNEDLSVDAQSTPVQHLVAPEETIEPTKLLIKNPKGKECAQVMFDYTSMIMGHLTMKEGDILKIISKEMEEEGWWEGELNGKRGLFPFNFVMLIPTISKEEVTVLQTKLEAAEKALADKQEKMDGMKRESFRKERELETIPVFQAQAEVYKLDFNAERAARERIHEEKELLCDELESVKAQNRHLQEELGTLARQSMIAIQGRHQPLQGAGPEGGAAAHGQQGARGPPLPPPPPPLPLPPPQGNSGLLKQIRGGTQLKKVEQSSRPVSSTERDALLDQIRQGVQLKTVSSRVNSEKAKVAHGLDSAPPTPAPSAGIVRAFMEKIQKRREAVHSSVEDEDDKWDD